MLALFRRSLNTWPVRIFFFVLVAAFATWGVGDVVRNLGNDGSAARVGSARISPQEVTNLYRQQMQQTAQMMGGADQVSPATRMMIAEQATARLVAQAAIDQMTGRLGLAAPDADVRRQVFAMDVFQDAGHQFSRAQFDQLLQQNGLSETEFLRLMQAQITRNQLLDTVRAAVTAPAIMVRTVYAFQNETRIAKLVQLPFAAVPAPAKPDDAVLQRWYKNHPQEFSAPEYRRLTMVILSPDVLARGITVPDADVKRAYDHMVAATPAAAETRTIQVIVTQDQAAAQTLAKQWSSGADWAAMQKAATAAGANAILLPDTTAAQMPSPELAEAAFKAPANTITGPIKNGTGFAVLNVTGIKTSNAPSYASAAPALRAQIARQRAAALADQRVNPLQDALAGHTPLEQLPGDLGLAALQGSVDSNGLAENGQPAPIPGSAALRTAIVAQAFKQRVGEPASLINGPDHSYFALTVDGINFATQKAYADVQAQVLASWTQDQIRRTQEMAAANMLAGMQAGRTLDGVASALNLMVATSPPIGRQGAPPAGVPQNLVAPLFSLHVGESTMVQTPDGFVVAQLAQIVAPSESTDPVGYEQLRTSLGTSLANDMQAIFAGAVTARANPRINQTVIQQIAQP
ncbi:peptidylprolyl isomerase [Acidisoma cladoniae]|uniref:peptidylprolyl isomerase n=1 Tax=Acidisoma cladoniae TaxID=3040935 RepID=UPI00254BC50E|nr:peptidylprolyl isomerase [Acidisoma sp. PAMC 29798]